MDSDSESSLVSQIAVLQEKNRRLRRVLLLSTAFALSIGLYIAVSDSLSMSTKPEQLEQTLIRQYMTMLEVEQLLGSPDRIEVEDGRTEKNREYPTVIRWFYNEYRVTSSDERFGQPGHISFVPLRFTEHGRGNAESHDLAREFGEQSDAFRAYSFRGSFPVERDEWVPIGGLDFIPIRSIEIER